AALNILKLLSELDQQANERTGNGPAPGCAKQEMEGDLHLKQANSSTLQARRLEGTSGAFFMRGCISDDVYRVKGPIC
ncbi:hypothetical protein ILYODFUR_035188, partial [Ilyodon furcidens]